MKILHISTASSGGSWTSAHQLVKLQRETGLDSKLVTLRDLQGRTDATKEAFYSTLRKTNTLLSKIIAKDDYEFMSLFSISGGLLSYIELEKPDLIHVHNWFNFLSYKDLTRIGEYYPVVFTMHDSRIATGGCHIPYKCLNYQRDCKQCPAIKTAKGLVFSAKQNTFNSVDRMKAFSIVAPSKWILSQAIESGITRNAVTTRVIHNIAPTCLPLSEVMPNLNRIKLLFVAANLGSRTKGLHILFQSMEQILKKNIVAELHLVGAGEFENRHETQSNLSVIKHGILSSEETRKIMRHMDILVVPSTSENFPNVILEAAAVGVVVVASEIGGIPEMITHKRNGYLFNGSSSHLSDVIQFAIRDSENWNNIRVEAQGKLLNEFNNELSLMQTTEVYTKLINEFSEKTSK